MKMSERRRLHPIAGILTFLKRLRELILPVIFFVIIGGVGENRFIDILYFSLLGAVLISMLVGGILQWYRYSYRVENGELRIEYGVFIRKKRFIPLERIQKIDVSAGIIHRLFGLVKLQVETAGGGTEAEAVLSAIKVDEANQLREVLKGEKVSAEQDLSEDSTDLVQYKLSLTELVIAASTSGGIGIVISALFAFISQFDELIPYQRIFGRFNQQFVNVGTILLIAAVIVGVIFISWIIGIIMVGFKYANFTVTKHDRNLIITRGLIEKRQLTIPLSRIQAIRIVENPVRQLLGYVTVCVESAGGTAEKGEEDFSSLLFPLIRRNRLGLILEFVPGYMLDVPLNQPPKRSRIRYIIRAVLPVVAFVLLVSFYFQGWAYASILLIPIAWWLGYLTYCAAGWGLNEDQLILRYRIFSKVTILHKKRRIQAIAETQSFFQRKKQLMTIKSSIRSSATGKSFKVRDLEEEHCGEIIQWFSGNSKKESD